MEPFFDQDSDSQKPGTTPSLAAPASAPASAPGLPDIRVGTISAAQDEQDKTALWIDFGSPIGVRRATMSLAKRYRSEQLIGRQVCAVVNPHLHITSVNQVLALGMPDRSGDMVLIRPDHRVPDGGKLF